jgi:hypothetical protein
MRLAILNSGHSFWWKVLFAFIRVVSRLPVPDSIKLNRYRPDFYGTPMGVVTQEAMRAVGVVGWRPRADGCLRVEDQRVRLLHEDTRRSRGTHEAGARRPGHGLLTYRIRSLLEARRQFVNHGWSIETSPSSFARGHVSSFEILVDNGSQCAGDFGRKLIGTLKGASINRD